MSVLHARYVKRKLSRSCDRVQLTWTLGLTSMCAGNCSRRANSIVRAGCSEARSATTTTAAAIIIVADVAITFEGRLIERRSRC